MLQITFIDLKNYLMKRVLTFAILLSAMITNAQIVKSVGFKVGSSFSNQHFEYKDIDLAYKHKMKPGLFAAVNAEFFSCKFLSLSTDVGFIQKGWKDKMEYTSEQFPGGNGVWTNETVTDNYITVSPMAKVRYEVGNNTFYGLLSPRIDFYLNSVIRSPFQGNVSYKSYALGLNGGVGYERRFERFSMLAEYIYQPDFTGIVDKFGLKVKNESMVITIGVKYNFIK